MVWVLVGTGWCCHCGDDPSCACCGGSEVMGSPFMQCHWCLSGNKSDVASMMSSGIPPAPFLLCVCLLPIMLLAFRGSPPKYDPTFSLPPLFSTLSFSLVNLFMVGESESEPRHNDAAVPEVTSFAIRLYSNHTCIPFSKRSSFLSIVIQCRCTKTTSLRRHTQDTINHPVSRN